MIVIQAQVPCFASGLRTRKLAAKYGRYNSRRETLINLKTCTFSTICLISTATFADRFWTQDLVDWHYYLNNGVGYVTSTSFPDECSYSRAQINFSSDDEYMKNIAAYILAASKTGEKLKVVLDHDRGASTDSIVCVILSANATK
jgi:hypothetical protein